MIRAVGLAAVTGALLGLGWAFAYTPVSHPLLVVGLATAVVAVIIERTLTLLRLGSPLGVVLGLVLGLGVGPAALWPLHDAGALGGAKGAVVDALAVGLLALAGGALGALARRGAAGAAGAAAATLALLGGLSQTGALFHKDAAVETQPKAASDGGEFPKQKVVIIGIDGADWSVIDPLIAEGKLPSIGKLIASGQAGVLRSIVPTYSPVVWTTIFSGQPPEVHGLVDWYSSDARSRLVPMLWDIFGAHGRRSVTVNVPGSWPTAEVDGGVLLSGFPIPGLGTGEKGQLLGVVASTARESGKVPTADVRALGGGRFSMDLSIAAPDLKPRWPGVRNILLDTAVRKQALSLNGHRLALEARLDPDAPGGAITLSGPSLKAPVTVRPGAWSSWLRVHEDDLDAVLRVYALEASVDTLRLYFTPAYQSPMAPRFPFTSGLKDLTLFQYGEPYIVEGLGWKAHEDDRVAALVPAALGDVEEGHVAAGESLQVSLKPDLFSFVITLTDRVSHPFWPLHERAAYEGRLTPPPGLEREDPVLDAYATADVALGRLLARAPQDALVMVVSDHGFTSTDQKVEGEHRLEGVWIAAGPMVPHVAERVELQVADVVPTVLACVGAPGASDFPGVAARGLCPDVPAVAPVATYRRTGEPASAHPARIDQSREDQLKSLGYIEEDAP